jgi:hypothetical protein
MKNLTIEQLIKRAKKDLTLALRLIKDMESLEKLEGVEETPVEENLETPSEEISEGEEVASEEASEEIEETPSV